ncbi:MAG: metallophosphoesterase family protein [Candidatus Omnitrophota bacterium]
MKIGVISDTHIPDRAKELPREVLNALCGVELILHAGDLVQISVLEELKKIAKVKAVCGNMDLPEVRDVLARKEIIEVGGFKIGLIHGWGPADKLPETIKNEFSSKMDIIVFGHSHNPLNQVIKGTLFFNPGSPTDKAFSVYNSFGIININDKIIGEIIKI